MINLLQRSCPPVSAVRAATVLVVASLSGVAVQAADANWPQWRGPRATGVAESGNPPIEWSETKNVRWKAPIAGLGSSSPIVWGDRVFVTTAVDTGDRAPITEDTRPQQERAANPLGAPPSEILSFEIVAFDRKDGSELWRTVAVREQPHEGRHSTGTYASGSPVTDGDRLFVSFGSRGVFALSLDGEVLWKKDLGDMRTRYGFGEGASPTLHDGALVINWDHQGESFIVALDGETGEERWRVERDEETSWTTPLVVDFDGGTQVVTSATSLVRSYDLASGEQLWQASGMTLNAIPSPMSEDGVVYLTSGFRGNSMMAIDLAGARGDITGSEHVKWSLDHDTPYVPSALLYDGRLYFLKSNSGILSVANAATGEIVYGPERLDAVRNVYASPVAVADRVYIVGRQGNAVVIQHGDELEILAENRLDDDFDASPAIAGDELYLRGTGSLYCIARP